MMHKHDPQIQEDGFHWLLADFEIFIGDLIVEFGKPENAEIAPWLLELIGRSRAPQAVALLVDQLRSDSAELRSWAIRGLKNVDRKEARQALVAARAYSFESDEATENFRQELDRLLGPAQPWQRISDGR